MKKKIQALVMAGLITVSVGSTALNVEAYEKQENQNCNTGVVYVGWFERIKKIDIDDLEDIIEKFFGCRIDLDSLINRPDSETTEKPEVETPEVEKPETEKPEVETPEVEKPETEKPEVETPEVEKPETEKPEVETPEVEKPETEKPEVETPEVEKPEIETPEVETPNVEKPETEKPEVETPEVDNSFSAYQREVLDLVNVERAKVGLDALTLNNEISEVATIKSQDMIDNNYFSHNSPTYGSPFDMMKQFNVSYRSAGENIAYGQETPKEVMNSWMNSDGHRKNILSPDFNQLGVGVAKASNGQLYWTQMFIGK